MKAYCLLESGSEGIFFKHPIALQLACLAGQSMINYGMHMTIKFGCSEVEEYIDITSVEYYDAILGTPILLRMGVTLDFKISELIWMGNEVIPMGKVSFDVGTKVVG